MVVVFSFLIFLLYRATSPPLTTQKKWLLSILRILALSSIFLVVASSIFSFTFRQDLTPTLAVLVDNSASMNFTDQGGSRKKVLESILASDILKRFPSNVNLAYYHFSDTLTKSSPSDKLDWEGKSTSLGNALAYLKNETKEKNVVGALILSDGGDNFGPDPIKVSSELDFPVYTAGIGSQIFPQDVAIEEIIYDEIVYKDNPITMEVSVTSYGFANKKIPVEIREGKNLLARQEIQLSGSGQKQKLALSLTPQEEGLHKYNLTLPHLSGELSYKNNQRGFSLKVLKNRVKVLAFTNNLSWEFTFLKRFLESQKNLDCSFVVYGTNQKPLIKEFPRTEKELEKYDLLISVNSTADFFRGKEERFNAWVLNNGKPILMLLGPEAPALARLNPNLKFVPVTLASAKTGLANFQLQLTPEGKFNSITNLATSESENLKIWSGLPPFLGIAQVESVHSDAKVLAAYSILTGEEELPGVVVKNFPSGGKIMVTLAYPFWRWDFLQWGIGNSNQRYQTFWGNAVRWLTAPEEKEKFFVKTDKLIYQSGEKVNFQAQIYDESFQKISGAEIQVKTALRLGNKNEPASDLILIEDEPGNYKGELKAAQPGRYFYKASIKKDGNPLGSPKGEFVVDEFSLEDQSLTMNKKLLTQIAEVSGGKYYNPKELESFSQDLKLEKKILEKKKTIQLWNHPLLLIFFILFISLEWFIRKKNQLP